MVLQPVSASTQLASAPSANAPRMPKILFVGDATIRAFSVVFL